jgi:class 3 adenylate cyclase/tetratricopeptide (TPR) repeat protein
VVVCPSCGKENPEGFAFCGYCTAPLSEQPRPAVREERKVVSILFCDLVGFTAASDRQDPEDVKARIRPYHARLRQEIERVGGTVEKFVGDAVMCVFGAPVAHEDDAERAVRVGLNFLDAIAELNDEDPELDLQVRVGINTGEAVVAVGARPQEGESIVTGDVVNTASRIQAAAPVNAVAVSEQTYRATSDLYDYEQLEPVAVKGKAEPLRLWRPRARARYGSDIRRQHSTPLVGRELEKPLLIGTYERAEQQRSLQLVTVVGEPGVGKSRLIAELFAYIDAKPTLTRWRQGRCLPYGEAITFWALGEIVKAEAGILESDSADVATTKLDAAVAPDEPERRWLLQRLSPLVGVEAPTPAEQEELFTAWRRFFEALAVARPTVLVFEDLHWADDALLAFLEHLAEWSEGVPLLVVCAARPELYERRPGWGAGLRNATTINLSPLSDGETAELVSQLISASVLTEELRRAVIERAGGNPLYAEEFVRLLADRGLAAGEVVLPETVQSLIAARLDTLSPERKGLLQDAAVVGKVFWAGALAEMGGRDLAEVELALHELARKELVRPVRTSSMEGEKEFSFWHLLVRDVAYGQIPRASRTEKHRAAAAWIERKGGERVEDLADVLAYHYVQALELAQAGGDRAQADELAFPARRFLALAGERALGLDTAHAEARLAQALELTSAGDPARADLLVRWADALSQGGESGPAAEALDQALADFRARSDTEGAARALQLHSRVASRRAEARQATLAAEAVALLEQDAPSAALVAAYEQLANSHSLAGEFRSAITAAERALALARTLDAPEPARALGYRGYARSMLGDAEGLAEMERALALLLEQGAGREVGVLHNNLAFARYALQGPAWALASFERGTAFCQQRGLGEVAVMTDANCPGLLAELGRPVEALERVARSSAAAEATGTTRALIELRSVELATRVARGEQTTAAQADWLVESARRSRAVEMVVLGLAAAAEVSDDSSALLAELEQTYGVRATPYYARLSPMMLRTALAHGDRDLAERLAEGIEQRYPLDEHALRTARALLAEHAGHHPDAAALFAEAAAGWHEFGNVPERAYALLGQGRCLYALGRPEAAESLSQARDLFASMGYAPALAETEALLEPLASRSR